MSRTTVFMPDEINIRSRNLRKLTDLAVDAELPITGLTMRQIKKLLLTIRATFDGRQFTIHPDELFQLHTQLYGSDPTDILVPQEFISGENAFFFWPGTQVSAPTGTAARTPGSGAHPLTVNFSSTSAGTVTRRIWNFGDGSEKVNGKSARHIYLVAGTYTPTLTLYGPLADGTIGTRVITLSTVVVS